LSFISGEELDRPQMDILIEECIGKEDEEGYIPYEGNNSTKKTVENRFQDIRMNNLKVWQSTVKPELQRPPF
jgi:hypothetical protein